MDLDANNQQTGDIPRRRVVLPFGFVSQNGRNLRVARSDPQLTQRAASYPCQ